VCLLQFILLLGISSRVVYSVLYFHVCQLFWSSYKWLARKISLMMPLTRRGDYLHKDQVEECAFVYIFVLFVYVTVCLSHV